MGPAVVSLPWAPCSPPGGFSVQKEGVLGHPPPVLATVPLLPETGASMSSLATSLSSFKGCVALSTDPAGIPQLLGEASLA